jgi:hypothetical protein
MKIKLLLLVAIAAGAFYAWRDMPGLRNKLTGTVDKYGGWTESARKDDPVGFIEYAEAELAKDLAAFEQSRADLAAGKKSAEEGLIQNRTMHTAAVELASEIKIEFQVAEPTSSYPVKVSGKSYTREELIEQVRLILLERDSYAAITKEYEEVIDLVKAQQGEVLTQITETKAALTMLPAKKELARIQKLTGEADELLSQVRTLLGENQDMRDTLGDSPVRSVSELTNAKAAPAAGDGPNPMAFLQD